MSEAGNGNGDNSPLNGSVSYSQNESNNEDHQNIQHESEYNVFNEQDDSYRPEGNDVRNDEYDDQYISHDQNDSLADDEPSDFPQNSESRHDALSNEQNDSTPVDVSTLLAQRVDGDDLDPDDEDLLDEYDDLPDFANQQNRELHQEILRREKELAAAERAAEEHTSRVSVMKEHLRNVQNEISQTQKLLEARNREIETEDHMKQMSERNIGRIRADLKKLESEADEVQDQLSAAQLEIHQKNEKLESFKQQMQFNQEELENWALAAQQKDEDNVALAKYTKADDTKIQDLTRQLETLTQKLHDTQHKLDSEVTETQAKQIELDKTAADFKSIHQERQELVQKWKNAISVMQGRDEDIAEAGEKYAAAQARITERRAGINDMNRTLERQVRDNKEMEEEIDKVNRLSGQRRDDYQAITTRLTNFQNEVELMKTSLNKAASDLTQLRAANKNFSAAVEEKKQLVEIAESKLKATLNRLQQAKDHTGKVEATAAAREEDAAEQEKRLEIILKEIRGLKETVFRHNQSLFKLRQEESSLTAEISGARATSKNLTDKIHALDSESLRQQELVYAAEFQIQQMERKVSRARGERSDEEKKMLQSRIDDLQVELEDAQTTEKQLKEQCKRVREEVKKLQREQATLDSKLSALQDKTDELTLQNKSAGTSLRNIVKQKEDAMVEHDLLKLEVRKLRDALSEHSDQVFSLENRKTQLELTKQARRKDIEAHQKLQKAQLKLIEEERHNLAMDVQNRASQVEKLRNKYKTICARIRGAEDGSGDEPRSQAYFVIQNAQKREELQREGDELDAAIKQCEREIKALVTTLKHLTIRNTEYRSSFHQADTKQNRPQTLSSMEQRTKDVTDEVFKKKRELQRLVGDIDNETKRQNELRQQQAVLKEKIRNLEDTRMKVGLEQEQQRETVASTEQNVNDVLNKVRAHVNKDTGDKNAPTVEEVMVEAEGIRDSVRNVLFTLRQLGREFPQLAQSLQYEVGRRAITLPNRPPRLPRTNLGDATSASRGKSSQQQPRRADTASVVSGAAAGSVSGRSRPRSVKSHKSAQSQQSEALRVKTFEFGG